MPSIPESGTTFGEPHVPFVMASHRSLSTLSVGFMVEGEPSGAWPIFTVIWQPI